MNDGEYRLGYRSDIEGLRAIAVLLVVSAHAALPGLAGGFVGVDVFFVLSGFLITGLLVREISTTGRLRFVDFYVRRLRRLLPALAVMLLVVCVLAALLLGPAEQQDQADAAGAAALWLSNVHFAFAKLDYFSADTQTNLFLHTWSLGVEEQFYLVWPLLLIWLLPDQTFAKGVLRLKIGICVVMVVSLTLCVWLTYVAPQLAFYMMPMRAWQFSIGALTWLFFNQYGKHETWQPHYRWAMVMRGVGWLGLAMILVAGIAFNTHMPYPGAYASLPTLGAVFVLAAGSAASVGGVGRLLSWRPLQALGRISYSWYLWHWPVLLLGTVVADSGAMSYRLLAIAISLMLAMASYQWVEEPVRHQRRLLTYGRKTLLLAIAMMALGDLSAALWNTRTSVRMDSPELRRFTKARIDSPIIYGMGCDDWYSSDEVKPCTFGAANAPHTVVLMGDSIAGQWFPAVSRIFGNSDWRLLVLTKSSCPMVDEPFFYERIGREYGECDRWRDRSLTYLNTIKPDVVLISTVGTNGFSEREWVDGTTRVLSRLGKASRHVFILRSTPNLPFNGPACLAAHLGRPKWLGSTFSCGAMLNDPHANRVFQWIQRAAGGFSNVSTIDLNDEICPERICTAERQGQVVFRDTQHLTASFAASLAPILEKRMSGMYPMSGESNISDLPVSH